MRLVPVGMDKKEFLFAHRTVRLWLSGLSDSTRDRYLTTLGRYVAYLKDVADLDTPDAIIAEREDQVMNGKTISEKYTHEDHLKLFLGEMEKARVSEKTGLSRRTLATYAAAIKSFYRANHVKLDFTFKNRGKGPPIPRAQLKDLVKLKEYADTRMKAWLAVQKDSALSLSEMLKLTYGQVREKLNDGSEDMVLEVHRAKSDNHYKTCLGRNALDELRAYIQKRETEGEQLKDETPLFAIKFREHRDSSMPKKSVVEAFRRLRRNAKVKGISSHSLRSFFKTKLENAGMPQDAIEYMMGHIVRTVRGSYYQPTDQELLSLYGKYYPALDWDATPKAIDKLKEENRELREKLSDVRQTARKLLKQSEKRSESYDDLIARIEALEKGGLGD